MNIYDYGVWVVVYGEQKRLEKPSKDNCLGNHGWASKYDRVLCLNLMINKATYYLVDCDYLGLGDYKIRIQSLLSKTNSANNIKATDLADVLSIAYDFVTNDILNLLGQHPDLSIRSDLEALLEGIVEWKK